MIEEKLEKKYVVFPICMIIASISVSVYTYVNGTYYTSEAIEKFDFTGMTTIFLMMMLVFHIIIGIFCLYKGLKIPDNGYDYRINKMIAIIFLVLAIVSILSFVMIRNEEEAQALALQNEVDELYSDVIVLNKKKNTNQFKKIEKRVTDQYDTRKLQISEQVKSNQYDSKFARYLNLFMYFSMYNDNKPIILNASAERCYYGIFSKFTRIDVIFAIIYFVNCKDRKIEKRTRILVD
ncbi:MAG: hypothetical protein HFJ33_04195 [Clostridia bacterium]|nr:hypothetical protein [Clostridia bacterium]